MRLTQLSLPLTLLLIGGACATTDEGPAGPPDDLPALAKASDVFANVPANSSIAAVGKADAVYPAKFDLMAIQSPVKNQGRRGVCTIFTTTALMESLYLKAGMTDPSFSEQYLQWSVKSQYGSSPTSEGSNIDDNISAIASFGIPLESIDPYRATEWTAADDADCKPDGTETQMLPMKCWTQGDPTAEMQAATMYTLPYGDYINTQDIKLHMTSKGTPVAVSITLYYQAWNYPHTLPTSWDDYYKGLIRYPNPEDVADSMKDPAGHGILLVGWDDTLELQKVDAAGKPVVDADGNPVNEKGFYIFKNSWGTTSFGKNNPTAPGYGYIAERYIDDYASAYSADVPDLSGND